MLRGLDCLERQIGRKSPSNEVRNGGSECVDHNEERHEDDSTANEGSLGDLSALFKISENRVFRELLDTIC